MRVWPVVLVVSVLLLAGCTTSPDGPAATDPAVPTTSAPPPAAPTEPEETGPEVFHCEATATAGAQVGGMGAIENAPCRLSEAAEVELTNYTAAVLEVTWSSLGPAVQEIEAIVESDTCASSLGSGCNHGRERGSTPPLRLELGAGVLSDYGTDDIRVFVRPEPVANGEVFDVYLSLFNSTVPPGYSALPST